MKLLKGSVQTCARTHTYTHAHPRNSSRCITWEAGVSPPAPWLSFRSVADLSLS